jgi:predicted DCC family thiol-disulfide oxidoreductase YuxK
MNTPPQDPGLPTSPTESEVVCPLNPQVLYDGSCPLCRREIAFYQQQEASQASLKPHQKIQWVDVSGSAAQVPASYTQAQLMARFHVQNQQGQVLSGAAAFVYLWSLLPGWRYLSYVAKIPGVLTLLELTYRFFLRFRPSIQAWVKSKEKPPVN